MVGLASDVDVEGEDEVEKEITEYAQILYNISLKARKEARMQENSSSVNS